MLGELENIDDDCEQAGVPFVKIDDEAEAKEYGIEDLPTLVYFENRIPSIYEGKILGIQFAIYNLKLSSSVESWSGYIARKDENDLVKYDKYCEGEGRL